jgi:hypothetical protein
MILLIVDLIVIFFFFIRLSGRVWFNFRSLSGFKDHIVLKKRWIPFPACNLTAAIRQYTGRRCFHSAQLTDQNKSIKYVDIVFQSVKFKIPDFNNI